MSLNKQEVLETLYTGEWKNEAPVFVWLSLVRFYEYCGVSGVSME